VVEPIWVFGVGDAAMLTDKTLSDFRSSSACSSTTMMSSERPPPECQRIRV
jgi:hypothetical protein